MAYFTLETRLLIFFSDKRGQAQTKEDIAIFHLPKFVEPNQGKMKMVCVYGWDYTHPTLLEKVERFISRWRKTGDNASYSDATFYGVITGEEKEFREPEDEEEISYKDLHYHIQCHLRRSGAEVRVTLLCF